MAQSAVQVGLVMGSRSDWATLKIAADLLQEFEIGHEVQVVSAHRTPHLLAEYGDGAAARGLKVLIAAAGGAAHLPGMLAAHSRLPVLGVPVSSRQLNGIDSLLSIVQMPKGVPVLTLAIGEAGAANAALSAIAILALGDAVLAARLEAWRAAQTRRVLADADPRLAPPASC